MIFMCQPIWFYIYMQNGRMLDIFTWCRLVTLSSTIGACCAMWLSKTDGGKHVRLAVEKPIHFNENLTTAASSMTCSVLRCMHEERFRLITYTPCYIIYAPKQTEKTHTLQKLVFYLTIFCTCCTQKQKSKKTREKKISHVFVHIALGLRPYTLFTIPTNLTLLCWNEKLFEIVCYSFKSSVMQA